MRHLIATASIIAAAMLASIAAFAADEAPKKTDPDWVKQTGHPRGAWWENNPKYQGEAAAELWKKLPIPPADPLEPDAALKSFSVPEGFRVELVAAEPLVVSPVQIVFAPDGAIWAVEMRGYMNDIDGSDEDKPTGRVVTLRDTDGDGRMDTSTVFLDGLVMPRAIALVEGGVLIAEPPHLWLARDTDGDGKSDEKSAVSTGYGSQGNPEHADNGLVFTIDNWMYSAKSNLRHRVEGGKVIEAKTAFRGQWGIAADDYGRLYYNYNASPLHADLIPADYAGRNPNMPVGGRGSSEAINASIAEDRSVYPVRVTPGVTLGLTDLRGDGTLKQFTAACGPTIYRGEQFPAEFRGDAFVCDPVGNLVKRYRIETDGVRLAAVPAYANREFLASTDERFRPVSATTGPDGALYIADMYNGIIEHKRYVTAYLREQIVSRGLDKGGDRGRIYRVVHEAAPVPPMPKLAGLSPAGLVAKLDSPNGTVRDMAQRMIVQGTLTAAADPLRAMIADDKSTPLGRLHALWSLDGLGAIDLATVAAAMGDGEPMVRAAAVRLSESLLKGHRDDLMKLYAKAAADADGPVALQLLLTLGQVGGEEAEAMMAVLLAGRKDSLYAVAAVSGLAGREAAFAARLMGDATWDKPSRGGTATLASLTAAVLASRDPQQVSALLATIHAAGLDDWRSSAALDAVAPGKGKRGGSPIALPQRPALLDALSSSTDPAHAARADTLTGLLTWPGDTTARAGAARPLTAAEQQRFEAGKLVYASSCVACHQPHGQGMVGLAPTLIDSEWVTGPAEVPTLIALHGLAGPIKVNGQAWNLTMIGWGPMLDDAKLADVLTYIRREWGNAAEPVTSEQVAMIRAANKDRVAPWTADELTPLLAAGAAEDAPAQKPKKPRKPKAERDTDAAEKPAAPAEPVVVKPGEDGSLSLHAKTARCVGAKLKYMQKEDALGWWIGSDHAEWTVEGVAPGEYSVHLTWSVHPNAAGKAFVVEAGDAKLEAKAESTGAWETFKTAPLGTITLAEGVALIAVKPADKTTKALMDLRELRFVPVKAE